MLFYVCVLLLVNGLSLDARAVRPYREREVRFMKRFAFPGGWGLVPLDAVGEGGAFVVFEVGEHGGVDGDVEVVGFVGAYGYEAGCHGEAVEVA